MVKEIVCNIFDAPIDILFHGANIMCAMYSGIAGQIRKNFPEAIEADDSTEVGDRAKLGTCSVGVIKNPKTRIKFVYNGYCQKEPRTDQRACNYEATYRALEWAKNHTTDTDLVIGIPYKLQAGLAGGDWNVIKAMIYSVFGDSPRQVIICQRPEDVEKD